MISSKTFFVAAFAAFFAGSALTANVQAKPFPVLPKPIPMPLPKPGPCYGCGGGYGGAGIVAGLAAAAVITAAATAASDSCWYERRWVETDYGPRRVSVRMCE